MKNRNCMEFISWRIQNKCVWKLIPLELMDQSTKQIYFRIGLPMSSHFNKQKLEASHILSNKMEKGLL